jgi:hypothetical protein
MTKNTKTLLTIAGVGVVGYIIYNQFIKKGSKNFANFTRKGGGKGTQGFVGPLRPAGRCGEVGGCVDGRCNYPVYGENGTIVSVITHQCSGSGLGMQVGQMITA